MSRIAYANESRRLKRRAALRNRVQMNEAETPIKTYSIAGTVLDALAAPLTEVAMTLYAEVGKTTVIKTTETSNAGEYDFGGGWSDETSYFIEAVLADYTADEDPLEVAIDGADVDDADFVLTAD